MSKVQRFHISYLLVKSDASSGRDRSRGAVGVEFALLFPILLLLAVGAFDFGLGMLEKLGMTNAARAGAQFAAVSTSNAQNKTAIKNAVVVASGKPSADLKVDSEFVCKCADGSPVSCQSTCTGAAPNTFITISVSYDYTPLFPYPFVEIPLTLTGSSEFRLR